MVGCREGQWERLMTLSIDSVYSIPTGVSLGSALSEAGQKERLTGRVRGEQWPTGRAWQVAE